MTVDTDPNKGLKLSSKALKIDGPLLCRRSLYI